jgi:hypothetical protein
VDSDTPVIGSVDVKEVATLTASCALVVGEFAIASTMPATTMNKLFFLITIVFLRLNIVFFTALSDMVKDLFQKALFLKVLIKNA